MRSDMNMSTRDLEISHWDRRWRVVPSDWWRPHLAATTTWSECLCGLPELTGSGHDVSALILSHDITFIPCSASSAEIILQRRSVIALCIKRLPKNNSLNTHSFIHPIQLE